MSAAAAVEAAPPAPKGKKKLVLIIAVVLVLLLGGGGAAFFMMKKKAADAAAAAAAEGDDAPAASAHKEAKHDAAHPPTFMPLEPFVVNLADKESDRYAQIGITLEIEDAKFADQMKAYMPAIRNGILMVLAHKTSRELLERAGKEALAKEILRESVRPLGIEVDDADEEEAPTKAKGEDVEKPAKKKARKKVHTDNPVKNVHFSNFIIQ